MAQSPFPSLASAATSSENQPTRTAPTSKPTSTPTPRPLATSSTTNPTIPTNPQEMTPEQRNEALTQCILSQYKLCAGGVVMGASYSVLMASKKRAGPWPMLGGGFVGTLGDFIYGYFVECEHLRDPDLPIIGRSTRK